MAKSDRIPRRQLPPAARRSKNLRRPGRRLDLDLV